MKNNIVPKVKEFYDIMIEENLSEMEYRTEDFYIYLRRKTKPTAGPVVANMSAAVQSTAADNLAEKSDQKGETVNSPINGVFYSASSPKSPPLVKEADIVEKGKTLCIIEAMKIMNEIKADRRMKILKILVENSQPVTQGQPLFLVEWL